jgi:hypothetical protein
MTKRHLRDGNQYDGRAFRGLLVSFDDIYLFSAFVPFSLDLLCIITAT